MPDAREYDIVIVGGGPAALSAAIYAGRARLRTMILERAGLGGQVSLTHAIDNYPGFPEGVPGPELIQRMEAQAKRFGVETSIAEATQIQLDGLRKRLITTEGEYRAPVVILAMGADPRKLGVPGEVELRGRGVSYCGTCDAPFFRGKKVAIVGGGDTAFKESLFLTRFAKEIVIVHRRTEFRAEKIYQDEALHHPQISFVLDTVIDRILGEQKVEGVEVRDLKSMQKSIIHCDGVFIFIGTVPNTGWLENIFPSERGGHLETNKDMMTSVPGIFAIGDVRKFSYRQIATAIGEGATAGIAAEHWLTARRAERLL